MKVFVIYFLLVIQNKGLSLYTNQTKVSGQVNFCTTGTTKCKQTNFFKLIEVN